MLDTTMLTMEQLREIQDECMADDLPLSDHMLAWTADEARTYFESGGFEVPDARGTTTALAATPNGLSYQPGWLSKLSEEEQLQFTIKLSALEVDAPSTSRSAQSELAQPPLPEPVSLCAASEAATTLQPPSTASPPSAGPSVQANGHRSVAAAQLPASVGEAAAAALSTGRVDGGARAMWSAEFPATGLLPGEWCNCELLQPLMDALLPDSDMEASGVVVLEIATTQLLKLGDADQQAEALLEGPQCEEMRRRLQAAELIVALVNDNEDSSVAGGGGHWSALAWRRSSWRDGVFVVEHYDSSGDVAINSDAAGLVGYALAERCAELSDGDAADRVEIWRMAAPAQHNGSVCGLLAVAYTYHVVAEHRRRRLSPASTGRGAPVSPAGVLAISPAEVEGLRRAVAAVWQPHALQALDESTEAVAARAEQRVCRLCTVSVDVVFDAYADDDDDECYDGGVDDDVDGGGGGGGGGGDSSLRMLLSAAGASAGTCRHLCRSTNLGTLARLATTERPALLRELRQLGVAKLTERQLIANALGKALRSGYIASDLTQAATPCR